MAGRINNWAAETITALIQTRETEVEGIYTVEDENKALLPLVRALTEDLGQGQSHDSPLLSLLDSFIKHPERESELGSMGFMVQSLLRHIFAEILADGIINQLLITDSEEANTELTKIHELLFQSKFLPVSFDLTK